MWHGHWGYAVTMKAHVMLADPLLLSENVPSGSAVVSNYTLLQHTTGGSIRQNLAPIGPDYPTVMKISHQTQGKGLNERKRHVVRLETPVYDGAVVVPKLVTAIHVVAEIPTQYDTVLARGRMWKHIVGLLRGGPGIVAYDSNSGTFYNRWIAGES